ncbi:MAG: DUF1501 domain-containing protein, partial [Planctomycetales bacterium]|nr:DUF1501 domain-containing protein [Planctomycetales bacterium]
MLTIEARGPRLCDGVSRREMLRVGGLSALGLSLSQMLAGTAAARDARATAAAQATIAAGQGRAKSCIVLFLMGGPPQHSTWDPKPEAAAEVRGEFGPIATNVPGTQFCELMPMLARQADKLAVLRAVSTGDNAHSSSGYYMLTGRPHQPMNRENANPGAPNDWPNLGGVVQQLSPSGGDLPTAVRLPKHIFNTDGSVWPGQDAGFLGRNADPWMLRCEPASPDYHIPEFKLPVELSADRFAHRFSLLGQMNRHLDSANRGGVIEHYDGLTRQAFDLLSSGPSRRAFDLAAETDATRDRYGHTQFGQSTLLARRLVEAGVRLVQVNWFRGPEEPNDAPCWDSHSKEADRLKNVLMPPMDQAFSALLEDLAARGLLDETLVVCMGEFGRTPEIA